MNSFNVYRQTTETIGGNTPVWLGTVKPIPVGGYADVSGGQHYSAGMAVTYNPKTGETTVHTSPFSGGISTANGFLYNDIYNEGTDSVKATCAIVMHHPEGLLIDRVYPDATEEKIEALKTQIPGVLLVREPNQPAE